MAIPEYRVMLTESVKQKLLNRLSTNCFRDYIPRTMQTTSGCLGRERRKGDPIIVTELLKLEANLKKFNLSNKKSFDSKSINFRSDLLSINDSRESIGTTKLSNSRILSFSEPFWFNRINSMINLERINGL